MCAKAACCLLTSTAGQGVHFACLTFALAARGEPGDISGCGLHISSQAHGQGQGSGAGHGTQVLGRLFLLMRAGNSGSAASHRAGSGGLQIVGNVWTLLVFSAALRGRGGGCTTVLWHQCAISKIRSLV